MWDAPALGLAAQAFLFTISLDATSSDLARQIASGLTVLVAVITMQLMAKRRFFILVDEARMRQLAEAKLVPMRLIDRSWAWGPRDPAKPRRRNFTLSKVSYRTSRRRSSYVV